jgi:hypothetical protein
MSRMFLVRDYHDEQRKRGRAFAFRLVGLAAIVAAVLSVGPIADSLGPIYRAIGATIGLG